MPAYAPRVLASAADEKYGPGLIIMIASVLDRLPKGFEVDVVVFDDGLSQTSRDELNRLVSRAHTRSTLHIERGYTQLGQSEVRDSHLGQGLPGRLHVTGATYSRLLIPDLSPDAERVVYLDSDVLASDDLSELFAADLGNALFGACRDVDTPTFETGAPYSYEAMGLAPDSDYYNVGTLVFDAKAWRKAGVGAATADYVRLWRNEILTPDQDGLNVVAAGRVLALDPRFNFQVAGESHAATDSHRTKSVLRYTRTVAVFHFTGPKPWLNIWFGSSVWAWSAARWWSVVLRSPLLSARFRARLIRTGVTLLVRESTGRLRRSKGRERQPVVIN